MIIDLNTQSTNPFNNQRFDICICGAGIAGITLALNLSKKLNVLLLEAGDFNYSQASQEVFDGENIGRDYLDPIATRLRYFGGTSNHWGGWCRPLDSHDFEKREYAKYSGWPISIKDLEPYLKKTISILDIPNADQKRPDPLESAIVQFPDFNAVDFWFSKPTRFGSKYRKDIVDSKNITCALNANLTDVNLADSKARVQKIQISNYKQQNFTVDTDKLVLAAGGIETPRLMLNMNRQMKNGLGNDNGLVGRFFCEHPHSTVGRFIYSKNAPRLQKERLFITPSPTMMQQLKISNFGLRVQPPNLSKREYLENMMCGNQNINSSDKTQDKCEYEGMLRMASEQTPNYNSRITLNDKQDKFGLKRLSVDWQISPLDIHTIKQGVIHFGKTFAKLNLGRVQIAPWLRDENPQFPSTKEDEVGGSHHMCTTRMASSPKEGVVDKNHKVFGIDNLYVAGSSAFGSGGHVNPTLTIVQMTLRLADHLNKITRA